MRRRKTVQPYTWLAEHYDEIFDFRSPFDSARRRILEPILPRVESACDLACGTGTTALELAGMGIKVFGVDLSPAMCRITRSKAKQAGLPVRIVRADMREFRLPHPVDLITCEADALNHVPRKSDLPWVARAIARALHPGGHFYFDVNNRLCFEKLWPLTHWIDRPGVAVVMHGGYDRRRGTAWSDVEGFVRDGNRWRRRHAHVEEVCWSASEIRGTLRETGFDKIRSWDATTVVKNDPVVRRGYRTFYLARKSPG